MSAFLHNLSRWMQPLHRALDALLYSVSVYALPLVIGVMSLLALLVWESSYPAPDATPLELQSAEQSGEALTPAQALKLVANFELKPL